MFRIESVSLSLSPGDQVRFGESLVAYSIRNGTRPKVSEIRHEPDGNIHAAFNLDGDRRIEGPWAFFAAARRSRNLLPPRIVHALPAPSTRPRGGTFERPCFISRALPTPARFMSA